MKAIVKLKKIDIIFYLVQYNYCFKYIKVINRKKAIQ